MAANNPGPLLAFSDSVEQRSVILVSASFASDRIRPKLNRYLNIKMLFSRLKFRGRRKKVAGGAMLGEVLGTR